LNISSTTSSEDSSAKNATEISHKAIDNRAGDAIDAGLHIVFDSVYDGQPPRAAEIEYVPSSAAPLHTDRHSTSVVAIHGLNFKGKTNHARETWTKGGKLWLKDFLPTSLPKPARVMLFAYNSSPAIGATATKLDDHAKNLLLWLNINREASSPTTTL
jgi:hypothetical protein